MVPTFPDLVIPGPMNKIITSMVKNNGYPLAYLYVSMFHSVATAVGNSCKVKFRDDWITAPILFTSLVGGPGAIKSHPVSFALSPIRTLDCEALGRYSLELEDYRRNRGCEYQQKPKARQRIVQDITMEAIAKILVDNPVGICVHVDELKGWFESFDKYHSGGGDKETWLSIYSGQPLVINRKSQDDIYSIPNPFVSVIGTIQPGVLSTLFKKDIENGFLARILFVLGPEDDTPVLWGDLDDFPSDDAAAWKHLLDKVLFISEEFHLEKEPRVFTFNRYARSILVRWQNEKETTCVEEGFPHKLGILRKIETYAVRFCLVNQLILDMCNDNLDNTIIGEVAVINSCTLADYFFETADYVYELVQTGGKPSIKKYMTLLDALPFEFTSMQAVEVGKVVGISRSSVFRFLRIGPDDPYLEKVSHGKFRKKD